MRNDCFSRSFFAQIALRTGRTQTISFIELAKVDSEIPMVLDLVGSFNTYASNGGSSGSEIGDGGGGGNAAGSGFSIMVAVGVTMQIVYYLYDQCYNRYNSHGSYAIEQFLARIILGNSYGAWDKLNVAKGETVATDSSLYAAVLKYLGASNLAIQNYLDAYYGKLSITQNGSTLIPNIIWSWVGEETLGGTNRIYTIGDVAANGSSNTSWLKTAYTSSANCNTGFGTCSWMRNSTDTMICKLMLGGNLSHGQDVWLDCTELYPPIWAHNLRVFSSSNRE